MDSLATRIVIPRLKVWRGAGGSQWTKSPVFLRILFALSSLFAINTMVVLLSKSSPFSILKRLVSKRFLRTSSSRREHLTEAIHQLPIQHLRALDLVNYDPSTHQRNDVVFDKKSGKIQSSPSSRRKVISVKNIVFNEDETVSITWSDNHLSVYPSKTIEDSLNRWKYGPVGQVLWSCYTEDTVRSSEELNISFRDLLEEEGMNKAIRTIYKYGILLVTQTPIEDQGEGIAALGASLSGGSVKNETSLLTHYKAKQGSLVLQHGTDGPLRTLYGTVWSTTSSGQAKGASQADSAYGHEGLPLHTDMTYMRDPPGLQIFTMKQPAIKGGDSIFGDGFAAAERLRMEDPDSFDVLASTIRRYRSIDEATGWHLEAESPIINTRNGRVIAIRHNDLDRLPDLPPVTMSETEIDEFYERLDVAHQSWNRILSSDDIRLRMKLQPGDTMVVANQRCFHGRYSFETSADNPRSVGGCYISQDDLSSRFRCLGLPSY